MLKDLLIEYDDIIIGKRLSFSDTYFGKDKATCMDNAIEVIRYAFQKYLRWPKDAVGEKMNKKIMEKLHLQTLMKYIDYPIEYDKETDYYYLAALIFASKSLNMRERTIHTYERILSKEQTKYPKDYFVGSDGIVRAGLCLQYMINHYIMCQSINDLYYIFATERGYAYLREYKLLHACREIFETPVDFLHFVLPKTQKNEFYHMFYKFKFLREMTNADGRKVQTANEYKLKGDYQ